MRKNERLRVVLDASPTAIVVIDAHGTIALANAHAQSLFGYAPGELIGEDVGRLMPQRFNVAYEAFRTDFFRDPRSRRMAEGNELRGLRKDATEFPIEVGLNPVQIGKELVVLVAIMDISERERAEERSHTAEQMRLVIDGAARAMIVTDRNGRIALVNSEVERIFGHPREELVNQAIDMLVPERLRESYVQIRNEGGGRHESWGLHKDGREVPIEIDFSPLTTSQGEFFLAKIIDVAERKHAEELRLAGVSHAAAIDALTVEMKGVETSLEGSEARVRRQATRLESLWRIVNTPHLSGHELIMEMLSDAGGAMRPGQTFTGTLGHIDGIDYVADAVTENVAFNGTAFERVLHIGTRVPASETLLAHDLGAGRTQSWDDCHTLPGLSLRLRESGIRSEIATQFTADGTTYILMLASTVPTSGEPFGPDDYEYIEVLGPFFSHHLERTRAEGALRAAALHTLRHAERLTALWQVANNPLLRGPDLIVAMLRQAASAIRPPQRFHALLGRIEGDEVVLVGVGAEAGTTDPISRLTIGRRTPLSQTIVPSTSRTQSWDDLKTSDGPEGLSFLGWRSALSTQFTSGGSTYWLTFGSPEPLQAPFDAEDFIYVELLASSFADHMQLNEMEFSLREAETRSRHHAERLEALWNIANDQALGGRERLLAMLQNAAVSIQPGQRYCGLLGKIEDGAIVLIGVGLHPDDRGSYHRSLETGSRTPLEQTHIRSVSRTRYWDDLAVSDQTAPAVIALGWRALISSQFEAGNAWYSLTFCSLEPNTTGFDADDCAYIDVLAASFGNQLQVSQLEGSLRDEEERSQYHSERLATLRNIVNDPSLHGDDRLQAMLAHAAASIRPDQNYRGLLWCVDDAQLTVKARASTKPFPKDYPAVGLSVPLEETIVGNILEAGGGTRTWNDFLTSSQRTRLSNMPRTRSLIATTFQAGAKSWGLTLGSSDRSSEAIGSQDNIYVEVLATFFANHIQQQWQFERIQYQQSHDVLTGLLSRSQFRSQARAAARINASYAIVIVDIDAFREVNELRGHMIGDAVLVEVGNALRKKAIGDEIVGRIEGDVFGIFIPHPASRTSVEVRTHDFATVFATAFLTGDRDGTDMIARTGCLGVAVAPDDGALIDVILSRAGAALVNAKERGPASIVFYEAGMEGDAPRRAALLNELAVAVAENQFVLYYQPHIEISTGRVSGCEALIRWHHPTRGLLLPAHFIPFAEQNGTIAIIDKWVMQHAFAASIQLAASRPDFRVYFNLSGRQAGDPKMIRAFTTAARNGVSLSNIGVEITESDAMRDVEATRHVCRALRRLNVCIAIDDFGTGYSSLSSLKQLPVDIVKIDQSFVSGLLSNPQDATIAETIVSITKNFGFESLAEGVEESAQLEWLRARSCRYVQGFAICRPLPLDAFKVWLAEHAVPALH